MFKPFRLKSYPTEYPFGKSVIFRHRNYCIDDLTLHYSEILRAVLNTRVRNFIDKFINKMYLCFIGMLLGTAVCYLLGTLWLAYLGNLTFQQALAAGVLPFIPGDVIKMVLAMLIGPQLRRQLKKANVSVC